LSVDNKSKQNGKATNKSNANFQSARKLETTLKIISHHELIIIKQAMTHLTIGL